MSKNPYYAELIYAIEIGDLLLLHKLLKLCVIINLENIAPLLSAAVKTQNINIVNYVLNASNAIIEEIKKTNCFIGDIGNIIYDCGIIIDSIQEYSSSISTSTTNNNSGNKEIINLLQSECKDYDIEKRHN